MRFASKVVRLFVMLIVVLPCSLHAQTKPPAVVTLPPDLDRVLRDYETAWRAGNSAQLAALFDADGMAISSEQPLLRGRTEIERALGGRGGPLSLQPIAFSAQDTVGYIIGMYGPDARTPQGRFVLSLRRARAGQPWLIVADLDNSPARSRIAESLVRRMFDGVWSKADYGALPQLLAPGMQFHFRDRAMPMDSASFRGMVESWRTAFDDLTFIVEDVVVDGNRAAARLIFTGKHAKEIFGIPVTGRSVRVTMMAFFRFEGGRIIAMWEDYDEQGLRRQLTRELP